MIFSPLYAIIKIRVLVYRRAGHSMFDAIVFSQTELEQALKRGYKSICLCDNEYLLPFCCGIKYFAIGQVYAKIQMTYVQVIENDVSFDGFCPVFEQAVFSKPKSVSSHMGSYMYEYEYEYASSYKKSSGSASSYKTSFVCSFKGNKTFFVNGYGVNLI